MNAPLVVVVGRGVPSSGAPLLGCFELDQARALAETGLKVVYAALDVRSVRRWRRWGFSTRVDEASGVPIVALSVPLGQLPVKLNHALMGLAWRLLLRRIVRQFGRPQLVHAHFTAWAAPVVDHTPKDVVTVVTEHSSRLTARTISNNLRWLAARAYGADHVVAVSKALAQVIEREFGRKATVVGNVIDLDRFRLTPNREDAVRRHREEVHVVSTGNLIPRKRMDLLIDGMATLCKRRDDVSLTIVGEGPQHAQLQEQIESLGLSNKVRLWGRATRDDLASLYADADVFVMLSSHETFGVVWAEALACGLPVVAPRIPGPDEFVDESVGQWCEATPEGVADALDNVIGRLDAFTPEVLREHVAKRFSGAAVAGQLREVYRIS